MDDSVENVQKAVVIRDNDRGLDHLTFIFISCKFFIFGPVMVGLLS